MTIDERLEALTRSLELMAVESEKRDRQIAALAGQSEKNDRQIAALIDRSADHDVHLARSGERLDALTQSLQLLALESEKHDRRFEQAAKLVTEVAEGTARLLRAVEMHEHRLDSHDDRLDKLE
jgi:chromosome segregation ATPase